MAKAKNLSYEQVVKLAAQVGADSAQKQFDKLYKKAKEDMKDNRLRNTKLLLKNYRMFKVSAANSKYRLEDCEENVYDVLSLMSDSAFRRAEGIVESVRNSAARTIILVNHIDAMIENYRIMCERSGREENMRRFRVLEAMYLKAEAEYPEDIAENESIDKRTVYKDIDAATETLAALIFGSDCLK